MGASSPSDDDLSVIVEMMGERTGLWHISNKRVDVIANYVNDLSERSKPAAYEMLDTARRGEHFWSTKAEYFAVLSELRIRSSTASKADVLAAIDAVVRGSKADGMAHREWVKRALDVLVKISKE